MICHQLLSKPPSFGTHGMNNISKIWIISIMPMKVPLKIKHTMLTHVCAELCEDAFSFVIQASVSDCESKSNNRNQY